MHSLPEGERHETLVIVTQYTLTVIRHLQYNSFLLVLTCYHNGLQDYINTSFLLVLTCYHNGLQDYINTIVFY